jgi:ATP synthase F1 complex assembly factor 2
MSRKVVTAFLRSPAGQPQHTFPVAARYNASKLRAFTSTTLKAAVAHPITAHGPPPQAPSPSAEFERPTLPEKGEGNHPEDEPPSRPLKKPTTLKKRFWKNVDVQKHHGISSLPSGFRAQD